MMAVPLMVMYELSIIGARIFGRKKQENETDKAEQSAS
jgi:Sec-independent protein secretion pathway component TatC